MATMVGKMVAKKYGKSATTKTLGGTLNMEEVYYDRIQTTRLGVKTTKKVKKPLPEGLTHDEAKILEAVKRKAYRLDLCLFNLCGVRFGWSAVIGIVPAIGDVIDFLFAWLVYRQCCQVKTLPGSTKRRMEFNMLIDFGIGLVPILGDLADGVYKCNTRNVKLLEEHLKKVGAERLMTEGKVPRRSESRRRIAEQQALREDGFAADGYGHEHEHYHDQPPRYADAQEERTPRLPRRPEMAYAGNGRDLEEGYGSVQPVRESRREQRGRRDGR